MPKMTSRLRRMSGSHNCYYFTHYTFLGRGAKPLDQLRLALKWNRSDMAAEELFNDKTAWNWSDLDDLMTEALIYNKKDFVKLLLQHGVVIKDYLTVTRLRMLYNAVGYFYTQWSDIVCRLG